MSKALCLTVFGFVLLGAFVFCEAQEEDLSLGDEVDPSDQIVIGDMVLSEKQYNYLYSNDSAKRHGLNRSFNHWPKGVVPIKLDEAFDDQLKQVILSAMQYIMNVSCIKFDLEAKDPKDFVFVKREENICSSQVGNLRKGQQMMKLGRACGKGNIIHEMLHTLGFLHMHTAVRRDDFVRINYMNIKPQAMRNFQKYTNYVSMYQTQYDYRSIMHYSRTAFAIDKTKPTIIPFERILNMGQRKDMTEGDITRLNRMYKCPEFSEEELSSVSSSADDTTKESNDGFSDDDNLTEDEISMQDETALEDEAEFDDDNPVNFENHHDGQQQQHQSIHRVNKKPLPFHKKTNEGDFQSVEQAKELLARTAFGIQNIAAQMCLFNDRLKRIMNVIKEI